MRDDYDRGYGSHGSGRILAFLAIIIAIVALVLAVRANRRADDIWKSKASNISTQTQSTTNAPGASPANGSSSGPVNTSTGTGSTGSGINNDGTGTGTTGAGVNTPAGQ